MFWWNEIKALRGDLARARERRDTYYGYWQQVAAQLKQAESDLEVARKKNDDLDQRGRNFARQADDLEFQKRTLESVLEQLQIPVKLPRPGRVKLTK
jgi:hypothetical protein